MNLVQLLGGSTSNMENTEAGQVAASGMGAIISGYYYKFVVQVIIISSRTIYGGTYAFMKNFYRN